MEVHGCGKLQLVMNARNKTRHERQGLPFQEVIVLDHVREVLRFPFQMQYALTRGSIPAHGDDCVRLRK